MYLISTTKNDDSLEFHTKNSKVFVSGIVADISDDQAKDFFSYINSKRTPNARIFKCYGPEITPQGQSNWSIFNRDDLDLQKQEAGGLNKKV